MFLTVVRMYLNDGNGVISSDSIQTIFDDNVEGNGKYYGMGWGVSKSFAEPVFHATGGAENYASYMAILPERDIAVIITSNADDFFAGMTIMQQAYVDITSVLTDSPLAEGSKTNYVTIHLIFDLIYLAAFLISFLPIFFVKKVNWNKKIRTIVTMVLLHVIYPLLLLCVPTLMGFPFFVLRGFTPGLFIVLTVSSALAFSVGVAKIIVLIKRRKIENHR